MMRREQQRRAVSQGGSSGFGGGSGSYLGGGVTGYSPVSRFEPPISTSSIPSRTASPAAAAPKFKSAGMKLGSKKTSSAALLDALGSEALISEDMSGPPTPADRGANTPEPRAAANERGNLPVVTPERYGMETKLVASD